MEKSGKKTKSEQVKCQLADATRRLANQSIKVPYAMAHWHRLRERTT
jgi:hypothetical protein